MLPRGLSGTNGFKGAVLRKEGGEGGVLAQKLFCVNVIPLHPFILLEVHLPKCIKWERIL